MNTEAKFEGWAKVEVMGHQSHIGYVETQAFGGAVLFRIDSPEIPEEPEYTLTETEWVGSQRCNAGSIVKRGPIAATSVLVGSGSIYRIIPCDEAAALKAIRSNASRPLFVVKLADPAAISAADAGSALPYLYDDEQEDDVPL